MYSICQVVEDKTVNLGALDQAELVLGRDPRENGLVIQAESVSREHAKIIKVKDSFFFQDLDSTNGSWFNGVKCLENELKLICIGDVIQLAECRLIITGPDGTITDEEEKASGVWVFKDGSLKAFKESSDTQEVVTIGGVNSDFDFDDEQYPLPCLVVESRNDRLVAFQRAVDVPAAVGQTELEGERELFHNDNIVVSNYRIVCVSHKNHRPQTSPVFTEVKEPQKRAGTVLRTWENTPADDTKLLADKSRPSGGIFGRVDDTEVHLEQEIEENIDIDTVQSAAYKKFEQRLVLIVLVVLIASIFTIAVWWLVSR